MSPGIEASSLSAHVRYSSRDTVIEALTRQGLVRGAPIPVWPPRRLPPGLFISAVTNGWISIWSPLENTRDWFPQLTATLECAGVLLEVVESQFWIAEFFQDGRCLGRMEQPSEAVQWDDLWARTADSLEAEGVDQPWEDEGRFSARMDQIAASEEYQEDLRQLKQDQPAPEALKSFLPPHASLEQAWDLLTVMDRGGEEEERAEEESSFAEDYMDAFACYLGIRDAAWDPSADAETLAEGDYEDEEGLPEGWREFILMPIPQLPVL
jgi:hypothetical protein